METKALSGSEKQISWASDIRAKMLATITDDRARYETMLAQYSKTAPAAQVEASDRIEAAILGCTSAKAIIDARAAAIQAATDAISAAEEEHCAEERYYAENSDASIRSQALDEVEQTLTDMSAALVKNGISTLTVRDSSNGAGTNQISVSFVEDVADAGATDFDKLASLSLAIRDLAVERMLATQKTYHDGDVKRVYYLSMEFLIGRSLTNNVTNLMLHSVIGDAVRAAGLDWLGLVEQEPDAGLGNGGLGRLAACFMESMATLAIPAFGYTSLHAACPALPDRPACRLWR